MTYHDKSPDQEAIEAMAAAWLAQQDEGLTSEEQADFDQWQHASPQHAQAVADLERTWKSLQRLGKLRSQPRVHPDRDLLAAHGAPARVISFRVVALVTGLAAALVFAALSLYSSRIPKVPTETELVYATVADGYQRATLTDGSVIELNANTSVRVNYLPAERQIHLDRGEAHFSVAKNKHRPFIVMAGTVAVRAVGTAFNVKLDGTNVEVSVTEGRVKVQDHAPGSAATELPELGAGQRLVVSKNEPTRARVETLTPETVAQLLAWQGPRLRFSDTPLASVVAQFNRYNKTQLELGDPTLGSVPVDGSFRAENVETFIRLLESNGTVQVDRLGPDRIVLRRAH